MPADYALWALELARFRIRQGTLNDVETMVAHRRLMFLDIGLGDMSAIDPMCDAFRPWVTRKMQEGEYLPWFAVAPDGAIAAGL